MKKARDIFLEIIDGHKRGGLQGIFSVCSAHSAVLEACFRQATEDQSILVIESTSNQVDQEGGYTGMRPEDFVGYVKAIADKTGFPEERILLGGDHLGPNKWQELPAQAAMHHAEVLVESYVKAGFQKIHLDTSMLCADDRGDRNGSLDDEVVASRTARLCRVAEGTWKASRPGDPQPLYVIGTEVPPPGGAKENGEIIPTRPEDAARTIEVTRQAFLESGLADAWNRVAGVVVQPGVEYGDDRIYHYDRARAARLSGKISGYDRLVYEAHSTDYQTESSLKELVQDHFCILKVGPWLTFAYREALYALESIETEIMGTGHKGRSHLKDTLDKVMVEHPGHWVKYYSGSQDQQAFQRKYSFSDRSRYYWPDGTVMAATNKLIDNLTTHGIPLSLLSQFMPQQYYKVLDGKLANDPMELIWEHIRIVCRMYARACGLSKENLQHQE